MFKINTLYFIVKTDQFDLSQNMNLKQKLEHHYYAFDRTRISPDPLQFLHLFNDEKDIEVMGFIASVFAYGNVAQIINTLNSFVKLAENKPYDFILNYNKNKPENVFIHRFYSQNDVKDLFMLLGRTYHEYGSLKNLFLKGYKIKEVNLKEGITAFSKHFLERQKERRKISLGFRFMFPLPVKGSACKRMNLFLRWMIRKDELDFGLWNEIPANKLVIPVDTHIARISRKLKLTSKKNVSWKMAEEITAKLKKFDPADPVKYDFAICHIGMRKMEF